MENCSSLIIEIILYAVKSQFNESRFKVQNLMTEMEFHIKKSRCSVKSQYKESKCAEQRSDDQ